MAHNTKNTAATARQATKAVARASEPARRSAAGRALHDFILDHATHRAAAIAYYGLLALFPLILLGVSIAAFIVKPEWAVQQLTPLLSKVLPQGQAEVTRIVQGTIGARGTLGALSFAGLLWTGTRVFSAIMTGLNNALRIVDERNVARRLGTQLVLLVTIGLWFVVAVASRFWLAALASRLSLTWTGTASSVISAVVSFLLLIGAFTLLYRLAPRHKPEWRAALIGGLIAATLFVLIRPLFSLYVTRFAKLNVVYGSLAILVMLLLWSWMIGNILLIGGYIMAHLGRGVRRGTGR